MGSDADRSDGGAAHEPKLPLAIGQILAHKYQIESLLGRGGMGAVYVGRNLRTRKAWAIKVLLPEMSERGVVLQRFLAEAQAAGVIGHPGIVEIIDQDCDGDLYFLVMPKLEGEELAARIARGPLSFAEATRIGADIADAIAAAHHAKIIHRDLKPQNVFLANRDGRRDVVQVLDFGIAKLLDDEVISHGITQTRDIYGTPHYMSPEQLRSAKEVDERTDVYAIGVILYEALAGRPPYVAETFTELVVKIMTEEPPPLATLRPDVPIGLAATIKCAMARDRNLRYPSAASLRDALRGGAARETIPFDAFGGTLQADRASLPHLPPAPMMMPTTPLTPATAATPTTATTTAATPTAPATSPSGRALKWGVGVALALALGAVVALRATSSPPRNDPPQPTTTTTTATASPAATTGPAATTPTTATTPPPAVTPPATDTPASPPERKRKPRRHSDDADLPQLKDR